MSVKAHLLAHTIMDRRYPAKQQPMQHTTCTNRIRFLSLMALLCYLAQIASPAPPASAGELYTILMPLILHQASPLSPPPNTPPAQLALDRINTYRVRAGVPQVALHPALLAAAQHHADYDLLNYGNQAAWIYGPHGEVSGKPGFTGQMPGDRAVAADYPWAAGWEVMNYFDDPLRAVDGLMATVFHRVNILTPTHAYAGYGHGRSTAEMVDVIDFGVSSTSLTGAPDAVVFPAHNQSDVPLYGAAETPSPIPPGASYPVGYPITLQPVFSTTLTVTQAELRDSGGAPIAVYPTPPECGTACYALIPVVGLKPATTYTVHVVGSADGTPFEKTWSFTTTVCQAADFC